MARRPGRAPKFQVGLRYTFTAQWPREFARALAQYALDKEKPRTEIVLQYLEDLLVREGYLKIQIQKDPETGAVVRSYEAVRVRR